MSRYLYEDAAVSKDFQIKVFLNGRESLEDAVNKWLSSTQNVYVFDFLCQRPNVVSTRDRPSYVGVVYSRRSHFNNR